MNMQKTKIQKKYEEELSGCKVMMGFGILFEALSTSLTAYSIFEYLSDKNQNPLLLIIPMLGSLVAISAAYMIKTGYQNYKVVKKTLNFESARKQSRLEEIASE